MSLRSWKKEFYPVPASKCKTDEAAIKSAILKFTGTRPDNLARHKIRLVGSYVEPIPKPLTEYVNRGLHFDFDFKSCALCVLHYNHLVEEDTCLSCPLYKTTKKECGSWDIQKPDPYSYFIEYGNPEPMIKALTKALAMVTKEAKKKESSGKRKVKT